MNPDQSNDIRDLFQELGELEAEAREPRLSALPLPLQMDLRALLAEANMPGLDLDTAPPMVRDAMMTLAKTLKPVDATHNFSSGFIGKYRIISTVGAGSFGVVYECVQDGPHRTVAVKVLHQHLMTPSLLRRFKSETEFLGRLEHPGIARLYEAGTIPTPSGPCPFFAMELVRGLPITVFAEHNKLSLRDRLVLLTTVCDAVQYAHQQGIIHRDLKPANILVDQSGQPKVLDFGVVRAADVDIMSTTALTNVGQFIGTVSYMSPEQASGNPDEVDTRSDVYALGVIGHELLVGQLPYDLDKAAIFEALRQIKEQEPTRLSKIDRRLRGDVEAVIGNALEKQKHRRYSSASELAADIRRYLSDEAIVARKAGSLYYFMKFAKRHKAMVGSAISVLVTMIIGIIATSREAHRASLNQIAAEMNERQAALHATESRKQAELAFASARRADLETARGLVVQGDALMAAGRFSTARERLDNAYSDFLSLRSSPFEAELGLWALNVASPLSLITSHSKERMSAISFSPDGRFAIDTDLTLWEVTTGRQLYRFSETADIQNVQAVAFSPDGSKVIAASQRPVLRLWDSKSGKSLRTFVGHTGEVSCVAFSPDGRTVLSGSADHTLKLWDVETGKTIRTFVGHSDSVISVAISRDGLQALSGSVDRTVKLWNLQNAEVFRTFAGHTNWVTGVNFTRDGRKVISASWDGSARIWDASTGQELGRFIDHKSHVEGAAFFSDELAISAGGADLKIWNIDPPYTLRTFVGQTTAAGRFDTSHDGRTVLSSNANRTFNLWPLTEQREVRTFWGSNRAGEVNTAVFSPEGQFGMSCGQSRTFELWDVATSRLLRTFSGHIAKVNAVAFSPDGATAVSASDDATVRLWDVSTGRSIRAFAGHRGFVTCVAFASDGKTILSGGSDNSLQLWDISTGSGIRTFHGHTSAVTSVTFAPNGRSAVSTSSDHSAILWDIASGQPTKRFGGTTGAIRCATFTVDGQTIVTGGDDGAIKQFRIPGGEMLQTFVGQISTVSCLSVRSDGRILASVSEDDSTLRFWDIETGRELRYVVEHGQLRTVAFAPDGGAVLLGGADGWVKLLDFSRTSSYREFVKTVPAAQEAITINQGSGSALKVLGSWYAFRGFNDWAIEFYEKAKLSGENVSSLSLGRCYWMRDQNIEAKREFSRALELKEAPERYLKQCLQAIDNPPILKDQVHVP